MSLWLLTVTTDTYLWLLDSKWLLAVTTIMHLWLLSVTTDAYLWLLDSIATIFFIGAFSQTAYWHNRERKIYDREKVTSSKKHRKRERGRNLTEVKLSPELCGGAVCATKRGRKRWYDVVVRRGGARQSWCGGVELWWMACAGFTMDGE